MTQDRVWLSSYPEGVPADIDPDQYPSLVAMLEESFARFGSRTAFSFMGKDLSYAQMDEQSRQLAAYFQSLGLAKGAIAFDISPTALKAGQSHDEQIYQPALQARLNAQAP